MKITVVAGCRPEFVKLAPVVAELRRRGESPQILATGQHDSLLRGTPFEDGMKPDVNLGLPGSNDPFGYASVCEGALRATWGRNKPDVVVVQGDTASAYAGAMAATNLKIRVAHVEAGIRSGDCDDPFPEEAFRVWIDDHAWWLFAPTDHALTNLGNPLPITAHVTGNPGIDALYSHTQPVEQSQKVDRVLITLHRRESFGEPLRHIISGIAMAVHTYRDIKFVWPVHPNPHVREALPAAGAFHLKLCPPMATVEFAQMLASSRAVITDSGGVQEEACALGVPAIIARERTDRPESVAIGSAKVVGRTEEGILQGLEWALDTKCEPSDCFGDGHAAPRIVSHLLDLSEVTTWLNQNYQNYRRVSWN